MGKKIKQEKRNPKSQNQKLKESLFRAEKKVPISRTPGGINKIFLFINLKEINFFIYLTFSFVKL